MLNLTPNQLDNLTLRQFFYKFNGYTEKQNNTTKTTYMAARLTAALVINSFSENTIQPIDLYRFAWEEPKIIPATDPETFNRRANDMKKKHGRDNSI